MIKKTLFLALFLYSWSLGFSCTNFLAGKNATTDGSTLISYSADSYFLFGALYHYPAATYPAGTMLEIHDRRNYLWWTRRIGGYNWLN
jgi:hypothetical protein